MKPILPNLNQPGIQRTALIRKALAGALILLGIALHFSSNANTSEHVVVFAEQVPAGTTIEEKHLTLAPFHSGKKPEGSFASTSDVIGQTVIAPHTKGSPVTTLSTASSELLGTIVTNTTEVNPGEKLNMVPIKLADPSLANLLTHGDVVTVISADKTTEKPSVIAAGGRVIYATKTGQNNSDSSPGTVMLALPAPLAESVAAASLASPLTVVVTGS